MASLRDRLFPASSRRVAIAVSPDIDLLSRPVNLALLRRLADREQIEIGLVTTSRELRREALAFGLPVFESTSAAERSERGWRPSPRQASLGFAPGDDRRPRRTVAKP